MKHRKIIAIFVFSLLVFYPVFSQEQETENTQEYNKSDFLLLPILETLFSGHIQWRPDWPADIPPDAFLVQAENRQPSVIELFNETKRFIVRRDRTGLLLDFPFFYTNKYARVQAAYSITGALQSMRITMTSFQTEEDNSQSEEITINITFPAGFLPYSDLSLGGAFAPVRVNIDDLVFFVFIFESPLFLSETWYDGEGNFLIFNKASVNVEKGKWRITQQQIYDNAGIRFIDNYFDSFGNITEIRLDDLLFSAYFRGNRPSYWQFADFQYEFQWDTQDILTLVRTKNESGDLIVEYRYIHEQDNFGNWLKRQESARIIQFELLAPSTSYNRGAWTRRITYWD